MSLQSPGHPSNGNYCLMDGDEWWTPSERTPPAPTISLLHKIIGFSILKGTAEARRVTIVYLNFPRQKLITHFLPIYNRNL